MRWLMGCPKLTLTPGDRRHGPAHLGEEHGLGASGPQDDLHLGGVHPLDVLVLLGAARPAARRDDLGEGEERLLDLAAERVAVAEGRPQGTHESDGETAFVERRQERLAQEGQDREGEAERECRPSEDERAPVQAERKRPVVGPFEEAQQPGLIRREERSVRQEQQAERGRDGEGHEQRAREGSQIGEAQGPQEPPLEPAHHQERKEDEGDDEGREQHGPPDLGRRAEHDVEGGAPPGLGLAVLLPQPAEHVLDPDDRVVDERADRDREAAEGHGIERPPEERDHHDSGHEREGDGDRRDEGRPQVAEEEEEDDDHEDPAVPQGDRDVVDRDLDEVGLPEVLLLDDDARRQRPLQVVEDAVGLPREGEGVRPGLLLDAQDHRRLGPVGGGPAGGLRGGAHGRDLAEPERDSVADAKHGARQLRARAGPAEAADEVLLAPVEVEPRRRDGTRRLERKDDVLDRDPGLHDRRGVELDEVLADLAADRHDLRDPGHREEAAAHDRLAEPAQLHRRDAVGREGDERDLAHDRADRAECRPLDPAREVDRLQPLGHDLAREVDVLPPLELDPHDGDAGTGHRADAPDAGSAVEGRLDREGDEKLQLLGGEALRLRDHRDGRSREVREDVDRKLRGQRAPGDEQHDGGGDDAPAVVQGAADHSVEHRGLLVDVTFGRAGGEERAAPDGARAECHEPLAGLQALDERLAPEPAEDAHLAPREALAAGLGVGDGRARVVEESGERHDDPPLLAGQDDLGLDGAAERQIGGAAVDLEDDVHGGRPGIHLGRARDEPHVAGGELEGLRLPGAPKRQPLRRGHHASRVLRAQRHHDPERPHLHEAPQDGTRRDGLPRGDGDLGDPARPRSAHHDVGGRVGGARRRRRPQPPPRGGEPGFEALEPRAGPFELGLARGLDAQELGETLHATARHLDVGLEGRRVGAQLRQAPVAHARYESEHGAARAHVEAGVRPGRRRDRRVQGGGEDDLAARGRLHLGRAAHALRERALADPGGGELGAPLLLLQERHRPRLLRAFLADAPSG